MTALLRALGPVSMKDNPTWFNSGGQTIYRPENHISVEYKIPPEVGRPFISWHTDKSATLRVTSTVQSVQDLGDGKIAFNTLNTMYRLELINE